MWAQSFSLSQIRRKANSGTEIMHKPNYNECHGWLVHFIVLICCHSTANQLEITALHVLVTSAHQCFYLISFSPFHLLFYTCRHTQPSQGPSKQFVIRRSLLEWVMSVFSLRSCTDMHVIWDLFLSCFQDTAFIWLADLNKPVYYITIYEM